MADRFLNRKGSRGIPIYRNVVMLGDLEFKGVGKPSPDKKCLQGWQSFVRAAWVYPVRTIQIGSWIGAVPEISGSAAASGGAS